MEDKIHCYTCHKLISPKQQDKENRCPRCKNWNTCRVCDMIDISVKKSTDLRCHNHKDYTIEEIAFYVYRNETSHGISCEHGTQIAIRRAIEETKRLNIQKD